MICNKYPETDWQKKRRGKFTSSEICALFTEPRTKADKDAGLFGETAKTYIKETACELLTGTVRVMENVFALEWGDRYEPEAVELLKKEFPDIIHYGNSNKEFFPYTEFSGGSPDAVYQNIVFEIKCPENPANHLENLLLENEEYFKAEHKDYWMQLQMNMLCVGKKIGVDFMEMKGIFVSYCPLMLDEKNQLKQILVAPNLEFKLNLGVKLQRAEKSLSEIIKKL